MVRRSVPIHVVFDYFSYEFDIPDFDPYKYAGYPILIGVDPDVTASGIAVVNGDTGKIVELLNLCEAGYLKFLKTYASQINKVIFSAGWLNRKTNFHRKLAYQDKITQSELGTSEKQAKDVGRNHQIGIALMRLTHVFFGFPIIQSMPKGAKKDAKTFNRYTGWVGSSNQDQRDAGMVVYGELAKKSLVGFDNRKPKVKKS